MKRGYEKVLWKEVMKMYYEKVLWKGIMKRGYEKVSWNGIIKWWKNQLSTGEVIQKMVFDVYVVSVTWDFILIDKWLITVIKVINWDNNSKFWSLWLLRHLND